MGGAVLGSSSIYKPRPRTVFRRLIAEPPLLPTRHKETIKNRIAIANMHSLRIIFSTLLLVSCSTAIPTIPVSAPTFKTLHDVPGTTSLENIAIKQSGDILVTSVSSNVLYQVSRNSSYPPLAVATIPNASSLLGIAELEKDVFYVIASQISGVVAAPGSNSVWRVNLRSPCSYANGTAMPQNVLSHVAQFEEAGLLNGMSRLSADDSAHLLLADSAAGAVVKLNVYTGAYETVIRDPSMDPHPDGLGVGVNGIHVVGSTLYYTSLDAGTFSAITICPETGLPTGPAETIVGGIAFGDDFAIFPAGDKALITNNGEFTLTLVDIPGKSASTVASSTLLQAISAVAFGRERGGVTPVYVTASAGIGGNVTVGSVVYAEIGSRKGQYSLVGSTFE